MILPEFVHKNGVLFQNLYTKEGAFPECVHKRGGLFRYLNIKLALCYQNGYLNFQDVQNPGVLSRYVVVHFWREPSNTTSSVQNALLREYSHDNLFRVLDCHELWDCVSRSAQRK